MSTLTYQRLLTTRKKELMTRSKKPDSNYQQTSYSNKKLKRNKAIKEKMSFLKSLPNYKYCNDAELRSFAIRYIQHDIDKGLLVIVE